MPEASPAQQIAAALDELGVHPSPSFDGRRHTLAQRLAESLGLDQALEGLELVWDALRRRATLENPAAVLVRICEELLGAADPETTEWARLVQDGRADQPAPAPGTGDLEQDRRHREMRERQMPEEHRRVRDGHRLHALVCLDGKSLEAAAEIVGRSREQCRAILRAHVESAYPADRHYQTPVERRRLIARDMARFDPAWQDEADRLRKENIAELKRVRASSSQDDHRSPTQRRIDAKRGLANT